MSLRNLLRAWNRQARTIIVWFAETLVEAFLFSAILIAMEWRDLKDPWTPAYQLVNAGLIQVLAILFFFLLTGYLFTTGFCRLAWKGQSSWSYPACATALFLVHFEILNSGMGGSFNPTVRVAFRILGAAAVFLCTFVGGYFIRSVHTRILSEG